MPQRTTGEKTVFLLTRIGQALRRTMWQRGTELQLKPAQMLVLSFLAGSDPKYCTPGGLAKHLSVAPPSVTDICNPLLARGLIEKHPSPNDRRVTIFRLTEAGMRAHREAESWSDSIVDALDRLDAPEGEALFAGLKKLVMQLHRTAGTGLPEVCAECLYFRPAIRPESDKPHYCALLDEWLSEAQMVERCASPV
ncbi:MAG: MarR family winged helix-turn-helix transcriptional regulator [Chloroflexi bacterium]|nr:MarR family winged helix-turn-helix transcriptional regulator [Chloroflexota bacterium]